ncbi:unnamed protein product [Effrenium voratum]|nr:unnamed protein product [Effrenium voratum]
MDLSPAAAILESPVQLSVLPLALLKEVSPSCLVMDYDRPAPSLPSYRLSHLGNTEQEVSVQVSFDFAFEETLWDSPQIEKLVACRLSLMPLFRSGAASWQQVVTTPVKLIKPGLVECVGAHRRWIDHGMGLNYDLPVGVGHLLDRRSELSIDLVTLSATPQVLSGQIYLPLVRKPHIAKVSPPYVQVAPSALLPFLRLTGTGVNLALDGCCTISTDRPAGTTKEDRLKVLTRPSFLFRIPGVTWPQRLHP